MKQVAFRPSILVLSIVVALLIGVVAAGCGGGGKEVAIPLEIQGGKLTPDAVNVTEGDKVILNIGTDQPGDIRISRLNVTGRMEPGQVTELRFTAFITPYRQDADFSATGEQQVVVYFIPEAGSESQIGVIGIKEK